ncbi:MAG: tRNA-dihydrouridine synthase, partial [Henriciella sp.]
MPKKLDYRFSVAPMMDWTDRHCRSFHRCLSRHALLWSEMITADAVIHGDRQRLIGFSPEEHPLVLQLGGNEPVKMAEASRIAEGL